MCAVRIWLYSTEPKVYYVIVKYNPLIGLVFDCTESKVYYGIDAWRFAGYTLHT